MNHFIELSALEIKDKLPGATAAYFQTTHNTIAYTEMFASVEIPLHKHINESIDIVLEGILETQIGDRTDTLTPGMISFVPPDVVHSAKAITDCKVITVLHPKRDT